MTEHCGKYAVRVARIYSQRGNLLALTQALVSGTEMGPGFSSVGGFVDSVADREIWAMQAFSACDVDDIGIGRSHGDGADRLGGFAIEDGRPGAAIVVALPHSAVHCADVEQVRMVGYPSGSAGPPAAERANHAPPHVLIRILRNLLCLAGGAEQKN